MELSSRNSLLLQYFVKIQWKIVHFVKIQGTVAIISVPWITIIFGVQQIQHCKFFGKIKFCGCSGVFFDDNNSMELWICAKISLKVLHSQQQLQ